MQNSDKANVVSLFDAKQKAADAHQIADEKKESEMTFEEIVERNKRNAERMRRERLMANKSVLRSYRIKN